GAAQWAVADVGGSHGGARHYPQHSALRHRPPVHHGTRARARRRTMTGRTRQERTPGWYHPPGRRVTLAVEGAPRCTGRPCTSPLADTLRCGRFRIGAPPTGRGRSVLVFRLVLVRRAIAVPAIQLLAHLPQLVPELIQLVA